MNGTLGWDEGHSIGSTWMLIRNTNFCPILDLLNIGFGSWGSRIFYQALQVFLVCATI